MNSNGSHFFSKRKCKILHDKLYTFLNIIPFLLPSQDALKNAACLDVATLGSQRVEYLPQIAKDRYHTLPCT